MRSPRVRPATSQHSHPSQALEWLCFAWLLSLFRRERFGERRFHFWVTAGILPLLWSPAKAGSLMAPSAPSTASALSHPRMQHRKLGGNSGISSQNVTGVAPRGSN